MCCISVFVHLDDVTGRDTVAFMSINKYIIIWHSKTQDPEIISAHFLARLFPMTLKDMFMSYRRDQDCKHWTPSCRM